MSYRDEFIAAVEAGIDGPVEVSTWDNEGISWMDIHREIHEGIRFIVCVGPVVPDSEEEAASDDVAITWSLGDPECFPLSNDYCREQQIDFLRNLAASFDAEAAGAAVAEAFNAHLPMALEAAKAADEMKVFGRDRWVTR